MPDAQTREAEVCSCRTLEIIHGNMHVYWSCKSEECEITTWLLTRDRFSLGIDLKVNEDRQLKFGTEIHQKLAYQLQLPGKLYVSDCESGNNAKRWENNIQAYTHKIVYLRSMLNIIIILLLLLIIIIIVQWNVNCSYWKWKYRTRSIVV